ncbi:MAG: L,D-transpeptidase family protein [Oligoflexia bacterium]|nr:L,D-transpeptidase family protein [Oligoflexia bacterium]
MLLLFGSEVTSAISPDFYPKLRVKDIEDQYNFLNSLWFHKKDVSELDHYLSPFAFVVDKKNFRVYLYFYNGETRLLKTYDSLTGKVFGIKTEAGDNKTPEGIYFFQDYISGSTLLKQHGKYALIYGSLAVPMNYPNPVDKLNNRKGNGIWLHGTESDERVEKREGTEGCVAVKNIDVENMIIFIQTQTTPIIVYDELPVKPESYSLEPKQSLMDFVEKWRAAWAGKDIETYMSCYSDDFIDPSTGKNKADWRAHKDYLNKAYGYIHVNLKNISQYRHPGYYVVQFIQEYGSSGHSSSGLKRLYIREPGPDDFQIVSEEYAGLNGVSYLGVYAKNRGRFTKRQSDTVSSAPVPVEQQAQK